MGELVPTKAQPVFKKEHELLDTLKKIKKMSKGALAVLEQGLNSQDEKTRHTSAVKILDYYTAIAKEVNQDQLSRLLLEVKHSGLIGAGSTAAEDDNTPVLDFDNLHPDFADAEVVDMGDVRAVK